jgi:hypothetical protein
MVLIDRSGSTGRPADLRQLDRYRATWILLPFLGKEGNMCAGVLGRYALKFLLIVPSSSLKKAITRSVFEKGSPRLSGFSIKSLCQPGLSRSIAELT